MFPLSRHLLALAFLAGFSQLTSALDPDVLSRFDLLEQQIEAQNQRIEALEVLVKSQRSLMEDAQRRALVKDCVPKLNKDNVCVYDDDMEFYFPNANIVFNSSTVLFTGPLLDVNITDSQGNITNQTTQEFSSHVIFDSTSVGFSVSNLTIEDSNTTFTTNSSVGNDDSTIVFNHTKLSYNRTSAEMIGSRMSASDSSVSYGKNTNVKWTADSSAASFSNGADLTAHNSNVEFDNTYFELKGSLGRIISRVTTQFRGPTSGNAIDVLFTRLVNVRFEQSPTMHIQTDVELWGDNELVVDEGASLIVNGRLVSKKTEFSGNILMEDVDLDVDGRLVIDREHDYEHADIDFRSGVDVRFYNDVRMDEDLDVHGHVNIDSLDVSDEATIEGRLYCKKGATISGDDRSSHYSTSRYSPELLKVEGSALVTRDLEVERNVEVNDDLDVHGNSNLRNLHVTGSTKLYSLTVDGGSTNVGTFKATSGNFTGHLTTQSLEVRDEMILDKTVFVNVNIQGDTTIGGDLSVTGSTDLGATSVGGTFTVASANIEGDINVDGSITVGNSLTVTNTADFESDVNIIGTASLSTTSFNSITITGDASIGGTASIGGLLSASSATISNDMDVGGTVTLSTTSFASMTITGDLSVGGTASVGGVLTASSADISNDIDVGGTVSLSSTSFDSMTITGDLSVGGTASFGGDASIDGSLSASSADITNNLDVGGTVSLSSTSFDSMTITGDLSVGGTASFDGSLSASSADITNNLDVGGTVSLSSTSFDSMTITGDLSVGGTASIDGDLSASSADITNNLDVGGTVSLSSTSFDSMTITGDLSVGGTASIDGDLSASSADIANDLDVGGTATLSSTDFQSISVSGDASIDGLLTVGSVSVADDLDVGGDATVVFNLAVTGDINGFGGQLSAETFILNGEEVVVTELSSAFVPPGQANKNDRN